MDSAETRCPMSGASLCSASRPGPTEFAGHGGIPEGENPEFGEIKRGRKEIAIGWRAGRSLLGRAQREEVLSALDRLPQTAQELLEVGVAFDEIDFRCVDDQQILGRVAEKEMVVGPDDFLEVSAGDLLFRR
jgi:hypothetical protein